MPVLSEIATLTEVLQGTSLARFGHGELAIMNGRDSRFQRYDPSLSEELRSILRKSPCLVSVPHAEGSRAWEWRLFLESYGKEIDPNKWYGSAFFSRADESQWPGCYRSLAGDLLKKGRFLETRGSDDYSQVDELEIQALSLPRSGPVLLSCGPTATVLAHRLSLKGLWAVDIGNMRNFL